jgi:3-methyladenine DNA glycosylase Tag
MPSVNTTVDYDRQNYETILSQFTPQQVNAFKQIPEIRNLKAWLTYIENTLASTSAAAQIQVQLTQNVANIQQFCANDELRTAFNTTFRATLTTNQERTRLNHKAQLQRRTVNCLSPNIKRQCRAADRCTSP